MFYLITIFDTINTYAPLSIGVGAPMFSEKLQTTSRTRYNTVYISTCCEPFGMDKMKQTE